jgi:hypothetical protein
LEFTLIKKKQIFGDKGVKNLKENFAQNLNRKLLGLDLSRLHPPRTLTRYAGGLSRISSSTSTSDNAAGSEMRSGVLKVMIIFYRLKTLLWRNFHICERKLRNWKKRTWLKEGWGGKEVEF